MSKAYPNLGTITGELGSHTNALGVIKEWLDVGARRTRDRGSSFVRVEELLALNLAQLFSNGSLGVPAAGPIYGRQRDIAADSAVEAMDYLICADTTVGNIDLFLPPLQKDRVLILKKMAAANSLAYVAAGTDTIDGASSFSWTDNYDAFTVIGGRSEWHLV